MKCLKSTNFIWSDTTIYSNAVYLLPHLNAKGQINISLISATCDYFYFQVINFLWMNVRVLLKIICESLIHIFGFIFIWKTSYCAYCCTDITVVKLSKLSLNWIALSRKVFHINSRARLAQWRLSMFKKNLMKA